MWVNYKAGGKKLHVKQYLPDINGNTHSNSSLKVVKREEKEKKKLAVLIICPAVGTNAISYGLLEIVTRVKSNCQVRITNFLRY